jgi:hypothetical protein
MVVKTNQLMMHKGKVAVCYVIRKKRSTQSGIMQTFGM